MSHKNEQYNCQNNAELAKYAESVRARILVQNGDIFLNKSPEHAHIILREFIQAAKRSIHIYCGCLTKNVYKGLQPYFGNAYNQGVDLRVITAEEPNSDSDTDIVEYFKKNEILKYLSPEARTKLAKLPHFAIMDGKDKEGAKYRLETNQDEKTAIVCAYSKDADSSHRVFDMETIFASLWNSDLTLQA